MTERIIEKKNEKERVCRQERLFCISTHPFRFLFRLRKHAIENSIWMIMTMQGSLGTQTTGMQGAVPRDMRV